MGRIQPLTSNWEDNPVGEPGISVLPKAHSQFVPCLNQIKWGFSHTLRRGQSPIKSSEPAGVTQIHASLQMSSLRPRLLGRHRVRITHLKFVYQDFLGRSFWYRDCYSLVPNHLGPIRPIPPCTNLWSPVGLLLCPKGGFTFISRNKCSVRVNRKRLHLHQISYHSLPSISIPCLNGDGLT